MKSSLIDAILIVHFIWAGWMILGVVLAIAGFRWPRLWRWKVFRIAHLAGLCGTATVPLWGGGICPMTRWEWDLRTAGTANGPVTESFLVGMIREILYVDVDPLILSLVTAAGALVTVLIFVFRPPWRSRTAR